MGLNKTGSKTGGWLNKRAKWAQHQWVGFKTHVGGLNKTDGMGSIKIKTGVRLNKKKG